MRETDLPPFRPAVDERDIAAVAEALRGGRFACGQHARALETRFAARARVKHAVALSSAAAGLRLGLASLEIGAGDEVVLPALALPAAAHAVRGCGAVPVFCDVDEETLCATPRTIEAAVTERTRAIVVGHYAGRPAHVAAIAAFARRRGFALVEDAASAAGMLDDGRWAGAESDAAIYGFSAADPITTGNGGMLVTSDDALAERVRRLALHGLDRDGWTRWCAGTSTQYDATVSGFDETLPDLNAALGLSQLDRMEALQARREEIVAQYLAMLEQMHGVEAAAIGRIGLRDRHCWAFFPVVVDPAAGVSRDQLVATLRAAHIGTAVRYPPVHLLAAYREGAHPLPVTERVCAGLFSLPLSAQMSDDDVNDVIEALTAAATRMPTPA